MTDPFTELDLHGLTVEEAMPLVDGFLHRSRKAHLLRVWVIHGKGTGTLRRVMKDYLSKHPLVAHCSTADGRHGGLGCTQVDLNG